MRLVTPPYISSCNYFECSVSLFKCITFSLNFLQALFSLQVVLTTAMIIIHIFTWPEIHFTFARGTADRDAGSRDEITQLRSFCMKKLNDKDEVWITKK